MTLGHFGVTWEPLGSHIGTLGGHFGSLRSDSGALWNHFGALWGHFGSSWGHFGATLGPDPVLDGPMCKSNTFCGGFFISKRSANHRKPSQIIVNHPDPSRGGRSCLSIGYSKCVTLFFLSIYLSIYLSIDLFIDLFIYLFIDLSIIQSINRFM